MKSRIRKMMGKALANDEVEKLTGGQAEFVIYPDMHKFDDIDEMLGPHGCAFVLYETHEGYGHYICVIKHKDRIEAFDPYGLKIDQEIKWIPEYFRKQTQQDVPHLSRLVYASGMPLEYNHTQLQEKASDVSTCGRHVACRINNRHIPLTKYVKKLKSVPGLSPDEVVTLMTSQV